MPRTLFMFVVAALLGVGSAYGQEVGAGAGRIEVSAFPGGGIFFNESADQTEPNFTNYALGGAFTYNASRWFAVEGEVGGGLGMRQNMTFNGVTLNNQKTPHMLGYTANVVFNPGGSDHAFVPYAAGGVGGLTMFNTADVEAIGIANNQTYFTSNVGGGLKWFSRHHVGVRGDYRFIAVKNRDTAPLFFGQTENRYGHRVYGGIVLTY